MSIIIGTAAVAAGMILQGIDLYEPKNPNTNPITKNHRQLFNLKK